MFDRAVAFTGADRGLLLEVRGVNTQDDGCTMGAVFEVRKQDPD
jgi:hypothetical protein